MLKYKNDRLESIVSGLHYVSIHYDGVRCDSVRRDVTCPDSAGVETSVLRVKNFLSSPLCAAPVDLLDPPHLQVLHGVIRLAKVGCNWFSCFPCSYVGVVSVYSDVQAVLCHSDIL